MTANGTVGHWGPAKNGAMLCDLDAALAQIEKPLFAVTQNGKPAFAVGGAFGGGRESLPVCAYVGPLPLANLGDPAFCVDHRLKYPYCAGAMANGIACEEVVEAMAHAGMLAFFGAAGLPPARIEQALERLKKTLGGRPYGFNLINSPNDILWQEQVADLYIKHGMRLVEASAYLALTLALVRYRVAGIHRGEDGKVVAPNHVIAKVSRLEVATRFFSPPPGKYLKKLVESGNITAEQAEMAVEIPMAQDVTAEADSGGHTDHRSAVALLPELLTLRDAMQAKYKYNVNLRVGLSGGISTPASAAAAFAMGAAYILTGSVNQACREAATSDGVKEVLAKASQTDVERAPSADMFEMGVTVQVLKKGTRFAQRAAKLYELYRTYNAIDDIPQDEREKIEKDIFQAPLEKIWEDTRNFFLERDPAQVERAGKNPRHKMALVFRWYLGQSSGWAKRGVGEREEDFQIWCGPSMGAFNGWTKGTFLEAPENRKVAEVAINILYGAAVLLRASALRQQGVPVPDSANRARPLALPQLEAFLS